jgi:hypothetical protein
MIFGEFRIVLRQCLCPQCRGENLPDGTTVLKDGGPLRVDTVEKLDWHSFLRPKRQLFSQALARKPLKLRERCVRQNV